MRKSLLALDTDHMKGYIFQTDRLKEIRGANLLLDRLIRVTMQEVAHEPSIGAELIYGNGGVGLFLVDDDKASAFGKRVQRAFLDSSRGGLSIYYAVQPLPVDAPEDVETLMRYDLSKELELLRYKLREEKGHPCTIINRPAHPFLRLCDACGLEYAEKNRQSDQDDTRIAFYCASCQEKQDEDGRVKERIERAIKAIYEKRSGSEKYDPDSTPLGDTVVSPLWDRIFLYLERTNYKRLFDCNQQIAERPHDFHAFRDFTDAKEYLGLIYADANSTGTKIEALTNLAEIRDFANQIDQSIYKATCSAIEKHLPLSAPAKGHTHKKLLFPFDILLLGGDKVIMVTDARKAMDVALTIAQEFHAATENAHSLSVGVVLAPIKYPFNLLLDMVESTLTFAKRRSAEMRLQSPGTDDTTINFMTVGSGTLNSFDAIHKKLHRKMGKNIEFYATLRPYTPERLKHLLNAIRRGNELNLGRNKLYQLREAVYKMNLTQSISDSLAILRNWQEEQKTYIVAHVYQFGGLYQMPQNDAHDPLKGFPRVTFPWFADAGKKDEEESAVYRTSLLDFVELYDFVVSEGGETGGKN